MTNKINIDKGSVFLEREKPKHTIGLQVTSANHEVSKTFGIKDLNGNWIAKLHPLNGTNSDIEKAKANANLYAAAPELLEALKGLLTIVSTNDFCDLMTAEQKQLAHNARKAQAKAEGR